MEKLKSTGYQNGVLKVKENGRSCPLEADCKFFTEGVCGYWQEEQEELKADLFFPE